MGVRRIFECLADNFGGPDEGKARGKSMALCAPHDPPFRAEHVGSFLRPPELLAAREDYRSGKLPLEKLRELEDHAIREVVAMQESAGLKSITDGEFRRESFFSAFYIEGLGNVEIDWSNRSQDWYFVDDQGNKVPVVVLKVGGPLKWKHPIHAADFNFLRAITRGMPKITVPSPTHVHLRSGREHISREAYPNLDGFWADIVEAYQNEFRSLYDNGCRYVQIDETTLPNLLDPMNQEHVRRRGDDWRHLMLDLYPRIINEAVSGRPAGMHVALHLCRGNNQGAWGAEGGYDPVAEVLFNRIDVDSYFLEYDSPRAGGFEPLRFVPKNKSVVLGLVSSKNAKLESKDLLKRRIGEASKFIALDQLAISPQCGFASTAPGNKVDVKIQIAKLRLVVEVAREVWG